MKEILFKGLTRAGKWVYGTPRELVGGGSFVIHTTNNNEYDKVEHGTLCQYTGLKDKNKHRIFNGDIFKEEGMKMYVFFKDGCYYTDFLEESKRGSSEVLLKDIKEIEIIGNVNDKQK